MKNTKTLLAAFLFLHSNLVLAQELATATITSETVTASSATTLETKVLNPPKSLTYECQAGEKKFDTKTVFYEVFKDPTHDPEVWGYAKESFNVLRSEIVIEGRVLPVSMKAFIGDSLLASGEEISIGDGILKNISDPEGTQKAKTIIAEAKKKEAIGAFYEFPVKVELTSGTCKTNINVILKAPKDLVDQMDKDFAATLEKEKKIAEEVKVCEKELASKKFKQSLVHTNYCVVEECRGGANSFSMIRLKKMLEGIKKSIKAESAKNGLTASCPASVASSVRGQTYTIPPLFGMASCAGRMTSENMTPTDCKSVALHAFASRALVSTLLKDQDLSDMAKFAGRKIYEKKTQVEKPKEKKPEELDPDELVKKMAQEKEAPPPVKEEVLVDKNWVMIVQ